MADYRNIDAKAQKDAPKSLTSRSAANVALAVVQDVVRHLDAALIERLRDAALGADRDACIAVMHQALKDGACREDLADFYVPEVARQLGRDWETDDLGFVGVTIGVSRLQAMLRELGPEWSGDHSADPDAASIMVILPQNAYHSLGSMVLAGQLRRKGFSVRIMLGQGPDEIADMLQHTNFQSVFISASQSETLETLRRIVDVVKTATLQPTPVIIGGSILEVETEKNVTTRTGADYATKRPDEALRVCGLGAKPRGSVTLMRRT
jgi:methanogenic corrinoid protein MtbC1